MSSISDIDKVCSSCAFLKVAKQSLGDLFTGDANTTGITYKTRRKAICLEKSESEKQ